MDRGARHYLVEAKEGTLELGSTDGRRKQALNPGFHPLRIFSHNGTVYVFGGWPEAKEGRRLEFRETPPGHELERTVTVGPYESPVGVIDMDVAAEGVVLDTGMDLEPLWVLFDFRTQERTDIGTSSDHALFLKDDLLAKAGRSDLAPPKESH